MVCGFDSKLNGADVMNESYPAGSEPCTHNVSVCLTVSFCMFIILLSAFAVDRFQTD